MEVIKIHMISLLSSLYLNTFKGYMQSTRGGLAAAVNSAHTRAEESTTLLRSAHLAGDIYLDQGEEDMSASNMTVQRKS